VTRFGLIFVIGLQDNKRGGMRVSDIERGFNLNCSSGVQSFCTGGGAYNVLSHDPVTHSASRTL
jgi:hypothetical protein